MGAFRKALAVRCGSASWVLAVGCAAQRSALGYFLGRPLQGRRPGLGCAGRSDGHTHGRTARWRS